MKPYYEKSDILPHTGGVLQAGHQTSVTAEYESPKTVRTRLETEGGFNGSPIQDDQSSSFVDIEDQQVQSYTGDNPNTGASSGNPFDFSNDSWD